MARVDLPATLAPAYWDKQKTLLAKAPSAPSTRLPDELKSLSRLHVGLDWGEFGDDKLADADAAQSRLSGLDEAIKGRIRQLGAQAQTVEAAAAKFEAEAKKDKQVPKEALAAASAIAKAARDYRAQVDETAALLRKKLAAAAGALARSARSAPATDAAESKAGKLVRSRGLEVIRRIRKPAPGARPMRFVIVQGKSSVATYMGPVAGTAQEQLLKGLIADEAPFKIFKDPQGEILWEKNAVTFVSDRLPGGLVKKMQAWMRKVLKVNPRLRVRKTSGEAEESEGEDIPDDLLQPDADELAARAEAGKDFQQRLARLQPALRGALAGPAAAELKELVAAIAQHGKAGDFVQAAADLDEVESLLEEAAAAAATGTPEQDDAARKAFTLRLAALMPEVKAAVAAAAPNAAELKQLTARAGALAQEGDAAEAQRLLDAIEKALRARRPSGSVKGALPLWQQAKDEAGRQISQLQSALRASGDELAMRIADQGLNGITQRLQVGLQVALMEFDAAPRGARTGQRDKARRAVADFRSFLQTDTALPMLADNPFGVKVSVLDDLKATMDVLDAALAD